MKIFKEKQFLNRWWLFMFILAVILILVGTTYYATRDSEENIAMVASLISVGITLPIVLGLLYLRLESKIDDKGVKAVFKPFNFTRKSYNWEEINECYVREFNPVQEYGGWGIRGLGRNKKAYHIYGTKGIQIKTRDGDDFLIGTQRPKAAKKTISYYFKPKASNINEI